MSRSAKKRARPKWHPEVEEFYRGVLARWSVEGDRRAMALLAQACDAMQRRMEIQKVVARDGYVVRTAAGGTRRHPLLSALKEAESVFLASVRELGLEP
ncbi:MAG: hypothetical protein KatS3mg081_0549 [Gemmatimonadales bacterium]|nr:MAG: hypothetical protein KatS3mg081_0549 [Gemmatimonadales bacterium]